MLAVSRWRFLSHKTSADGALEQPLGSGAPATAHAASVPPRRREVRTPAGNRRGLELEQAGARRGSAA
jgi:hypothetical protein